MGPGRGGIDEGVVPVPRLSSRTLAGIVLSVGLATAAGPALGASTFSAPDRNDHIDFGFPKRAIAAGDVTGDGFPDIGMVGTAAGALWSQPGTAVPLQPILIGGAAFYEDQDIGSFNDVAIADVSADGRPDIVAVGAPNPDLGLDGEGARRFVQVGPAGAPTFAPDGERFDSDPREAIAVGQMDGTGLPELVVVGESGGAVHYLTPGGVFDASRPFGPTNLTDVALGDFGGNQLIDIAVAGPGGAVVVLDKGSSLTPGAPVVAGPAASIVAGDFNRDGRPDIAVSRPTENEVVVRLGQGGADTAAFGPEVRVPVIENPGALAVADLDLNGTLDLVVARRSDQEPNPTDLHTRATVLEGVGNGTFTVGATIDTSTEPPPGQDDQDGNDVRSIAVADIDRDGRPDLLFADSALSSAIVARNTSLVGGPGGGGGGSGGGGGTTGRARGPGLTVTVPRRQALSLRRGIVISARCAVACRLTASGRISLGPRSRARIVLGRATRRLRAGQRVRLALQVPRRKRVAIARALRRGTAVRATVVITASAGGIVARRTVVFRLVPRRPPRG